jgi:hypothetical protein
MDVNLRHNDYFVQDENWYAAHRRYENFLIACRDMKIVFFELGVGFNTPGIIRFPFEQMTFQNENATLIRINRDFPEGAKENTGRTIAFSENMTQVIDALGA